MKKRKSSIVTISFFLALFLALVIWIIWANTAIEANRYSISFKSIPDSFNGFCIVHVSDLHNTQIGRDNEKLLKLVEEAEPDLIALTGDIVDCHRTDIAIAADFVQEALKIAPCYYVTGNHEATLDADVYQYLEDSILMLGAEVLHNSSLSIEKAGEEIEILGLDDPAFGKAKSEPITSELIDNLEQNDKFTLLLSHRPEYFKEYVRSDIDLVLCGHTHGGQFRLPFIGGLIAPGQGIFPEYDAGLFTEDETNMIVNRGVGNSLMPVRFNNRPEVIIVELNKK